MATGTVRDKRRISDSGGPSHFCDCSSRTIAVKCSNEFRNKRYILSISEADHTSSIAFLLTLLTLIRYIYHIEKCWALTKVAMNVEFARNPKVAEEQPKVLLTAMLVLWLPEQSLQSLQWCPGGSASILACLRPQQHRSTGIRELTLADTGGHVPGAVRYTTCSSNCWCGCGKLKFSQWPQEINFSKATELMKRHDNTLVPCSSYQ